MAASNTIDLASLALRPGEARRIELPLGEDSLSYGDQQYAVSGSAPAVLDVARMAAGHSLQLRFDAVVAGPCNRCLGDARIEVGVEAREVDQPGGGEELSSPYVSDELLRAAQWAHDALALALPQQLLCGPDCAGLCGVCGESLNDAEAGAHDHPREPDPRLEKLREIRLD